MYRANAKPTASRVVRFLFRRELAVLRWVVRGLATVSAFGITVALAYTAGGAIATAWLAGGREYREQCSLACDVFPEGRVIAAERPLCVCGTTTGVVRFVHWRQE